MSEPLDVDEVDWDRTTFCLVCPDAIVRRLASPIVGRMLEHGFTPIAWRCFWRRPSGLDAYFEKNITQVWQGYLYRLADRVFSSGPTLALLVRDDRPAEGTTSQQRLRALKGSSEPHKTVAGTIRGDLRSINVSLGLMHSADSGEDSRRETLAFLGDAGFPRDQQPAELHALLGQLESMRPAEERGHPEVLAGLRARIVAIVWDELPPAARELAEKLRAGGTAALAAPGAGAQIVDLWPGEHPLRRVLRCDFLVGRPGMDTDEAAGLLRAYGSGLDVWEDVVLATSMRFEPRRD